MIDLDLRGVPPFARAAFLGFVTLAGCARSEPAPVAGTPPPPAGAAPSSDPLADLVAELDALQVRAERLAADRFALHAAAVCVDSCLAGVESVRFEPGRLACRCRRPNIGVHPIRRARVAQAAGLETLARPAGRTGGPR